MELLANSPDNRSLRYRLACDTQYNTITKLWAYIFAVPSETASTAHDPSLPITAMIILSPLFGLVTFAALSGIYLLKCLLSPLNRIPGPALAKYTSCILKWHELHANRTRYIHGLHLKYGPAVRIAPNEVAFASEGAMKEIYCSSGSGYDKTEFYDLFRVYGRR